jgi:hypothetical protein
MKIQINFDYSFYLRIRLFFHRKDRNRDGGKCGTFCGELGNQNLCKISFQFTKMQDSDVAKTKINSLIHSSGEMLQIQLATRK